MQMHGEGLLRATWGQECHRDGPGGSRVRSLRGVGVPLPEMPQHVRYTFLCPLFSINCLLLVMISLQCRAMGSGNWNLLNKSKLTARW